MLFARSDVNSALFDGLAVDGLCTWPLRCLAEVLGKLGSEHVLVVHAEDGLDEISIGAPTRVAELKDGRVSCYQLNPSQFGLAAGDVAVIPDARESDDVQQHPVQFLGQRQGVYRVIRPGQDQGGNRQR